MTFLLTADPDNEYFAVLTAEERDVVIEWMESVGINANLTRELEMIGEGCFRALQWVPDIRGDLKDVTYTVLKPLPEPWQRLIIESVHPAGSQPAR